MPHDTEDIRKRFILATTANYFELKPPSSLSDCTELNNFLDDGNEFILAVIRNGQDLQLSNRVSSVMNIVAYHSIVKYRPTVYCIGTKQSPLLVEYKIQAKSTRGLTVIFQGSHNIVVLYNVNHSYISKLCEIL